MSSSTTSPPPPHAASPSSPSAFNTRHLPRRQRPSGLFRNFSSHHRNPSHQGKANTTSPSDQALELELSSLPSPPTTTNNDSRPLSSHPTQSDNVPSFTDSYLTRANRSPSERHKQHARRLRPPRRPSRPPSHSTETDSKGGVGAALSRWYTYMKGAYFPLLRTSPAAGTGSYGALPVSYQGSGASSETVSDVESDSSMDGGEGDVLLPSADECWVADGNKTRRRNIPGSGKLSDEDVADGYSADGEADVGGEDAAVDIEEESEDENDPMDNSPYPEVRASVLATDDESLSINTPRMWTLSLLFTLVGSSTNLFFSLRYPSISITPVIALLLAHPLGKLWDRAFPQRLDDGEDDEMVKVKSTVERLRQWLGQGRWNRKEHACVYISSNVSFGFAFATDVIVEQTHFYHQDPGIIYQILLTLSTQILGYTFAGLTRQWLVRPSSMIWPGTLMSTAMFTTLHGEENKPADGWKVSRWRFFMYVFTGGFFWYFIPGLLMPALSYFNAVTWFAPDNVVVSNLFGVRSGLGMLPITFDWAQISYIGSPLMTPFWAAANVVGGLILVMWIIAPIMYYANAFYSSYMPILSSNVYDNTAKEYNVSRILTPQFLFDEEAYKNYSKVFMPITYVLSYGLQFAALTALVTHTVCWHGKDIWRQWKKVMQEPSTGGYVSIDGVTLTRRRHTRRNKGRRLSNVSDGEWEDIVNGDDVHARLMKKYPECPTSWYLATFIVMIAVGIFVVEYYPVHLPWPGLLLALSVCGIFFVPIGIVMAITNTQSSLFLVCQLICGTIFPGRPVANMVFVMYGYITSTQGLKFAADLKLGHYMKIPPRVLFIVQMVATIVGCLTQIGVMNWMFSNIPGICTPEAMNGFTCPIARVHFNGSILWGVVGPSRFFGKGELYQPLVWAFLLGAVSPICIFALWHYRGRYRYSVLKSISLPVLFGSLSWIPPATGLNFSAWTIVCAIFNWFLKRRRQEWWGKYTMTLSAALDASLAFGLVVVFFVVVYPEWGWLERLRWWGTEVHTKGCDWRGCAYKGVKEGEVFGPGWGS